MTPAEIILTCLGLLCGGVGALGVWILNDIRNVLHKQIAKVEDIDIRVVRLEERTREAHA